MVYNVENLFDDVYDGTEYREFDPRNGKWTTELFRTRIDTISEVIRKAAPGGPDIVALQEIENENVLKTLAEKGLADLGYTRRIFVPKKGIAANIGILTRLPVSRVHSYQIGGQGNSGARDILEIEILCSGHSLYLFDNHWKSKTGGGRETENPRVEAARAVAERVRKILAQDPAADVLVTGDMNESSDEFSLVSEKYRTALLPYGTEVPETFGKSCIFLTSAPSEAGVRDGRLVLYDPWGETAEEARGSYYYGGRWETVDHILMTGGLFDTRGFSYRRGSFRAYREPFLLLPNGAPKKWDGVNGQRGYSDHLPLLLTLDIGE